MTESIDVRHLIRLGIRFSSLMFWVHCFGDSSLDAPLFICGNLLPYNIFRMIVPFFLWVVVILIRNLDTALLCKGTIASEIKSENLEEKTLCAVVFTYRLTFGV